MFLKLKIRANLNVVQNSKSFVQTTMCTSVCIRFLAGEYNINTCFHNIRCSAQCYWAELMDFLCHTIA